MFKDVLKQQQKVVYQTLQNALISKQLSHCYLFSGPKGTRMKETAFLLAQSLVCEEKGADGFACEECITCTRIKENNYIDLVYIDGSKESIKNESVQNLLEQFEKTAVERAGEKIFIIDCCESLTSKAANSLLKFIEEPYGRMTGIFITSQQDRVLKTILSRCQILNFKPLNRTVFEQNAKEQNIDALSAHFISNFINSEDEILPLSTEAAYIEALQIFCEFTDLYLKNDKNYMIYLEEKFAKSKTLNKTITDTVKYFLEMSLLFIEDFLNDYHCEDDTYSILLDLAKTSQFNYGKYLKAIIETRDALNRHPNILLLIDQLLYKLTEETL